MDLRTAVLLIPYIKILICHVSHWYEVDLDFVIALVLYSGLLGFG